MRGGGNMQQMMKQIKMQRKWLKNKKIKRRTL